MIEQQAVTYNYLLVCKDEYIPLVYLFFMSFIVPLISDHCTVDCRLATRSLHYIKSNRNQILL